MSSTIIYGTRAIGMKRFLNTLQGRLLLGLMLVGLIAEVGIGARAEGGFQLSVSMNVALTHISQELAEQLVQTAHAICPYSNAIRGNIDVKFTVTSR